MFGGYDGGTASMPKPPLGRKTLAPPAEDALSSASMRVAVAFLGLFVLLFIALGVGVTKFAFLGVAVLLLAGVPTLVLSHRVIQEQPEPPQRPEATVQRESVETSTFLKPSLGPYVLAGLAVLTLVLGVCGARILTGREKPVDHVARATAVFAPSPTIASAAAPEDALPTAVPSTPIAPLTLIPSAMPESETGPEGEREVLGLVTGFDCAAGTLTIDGLTILLTDKTEWDDGLTCDEMIPGTLSKVHALNQDGTLVAREVELEDADD